MKIEEFRIVETKDGFSIQRQFEIDKTIWKWYLPYPKYKKEKVWCGITKSGEGLNIRNWRHLMPTFKTKQEAIEKIEELCTKPVYHYPPFK